jgi:tRNA 2-selenouridine synthase
VHGAEQGAERFAARLLESLARLAKRLGGAQYQRLQGVMQEALAEQRDSGRVDGHRAWISVLMRQYYDPMYAYQRQSRAERVVFEGERAAVLDYLRERLAVR